MTEPWPDTIEGRIDPLAVIGMPPEDREIRRKMAACRWPDGLMSHWEPCGVCPKDVRCPTMFAPELDPSCIIEALVTVDSGTRRPTYIGARVFLMKGVHVAHDCVLHEGVEIAPHTALGGHVIVGRNVKIGMGATIIPFVRVGEGARIGAGAVVIKGEIPKYECWAGNPAMPLYPLCWSGCGARADNHYSDGSWWCDDHFVAHEQLNVVDHA